MPERNDAGLDFFISHAGPDSEWAEWIGQQLVSAGYTVELDVWDWAAGSNFVAAMQNAVDRARRMIAVWSPIYFARTWTDVEVQTGFAEQAREQTGWLVPVVVERCHAEVPRMYRSLLQIDLVGLPEGTARSRLLDRLAGPQRPTSKVPYPGTDERILYPARLPGIWNLPSRNLFFTGREALLGDLSRQLCVPEGDARRAVTVSALQGPGGVGKSQLALEYAWRHATEYTLVWWINTKDQATAEAELASLAAVLNLPFRGGAATSVPMVLAELGRRTDWLLIFDNASVPDQLQRLLPQGPGHVIVTCRDPAFARDIRVQHVGEFSRSESTSLLRRRAPHISMSEAGEVAIAVADLPLAVAQAAAHLAETGIEVADYLRRLAGTDARRSDDGDPEPPGLPGTVAAALDELARSDPFALDLLHRLAFLAAEPIPLTAISSGRTPDNGLVVADPATTHEIVQAISGLGLAQSSGTHLHIHPRVQQLLLSRLSAGRRSLVLTRALRLLGTAEPGDPNNPGSWPAYADLTAHVDAATGHLSEGHAVEPTSFRRLLLDVCRYFYASGQTRSSRALAEQTFHRLGRTHGNDHPDVLTAAHHLANALHTLGGYEASRQMRADTLARRRRVLGDDHKDTLVSANNFAVDLFDHGEFAAARAMDADTFDRRRRVLGEDHPHTLISANNLAADLRALGEVNAARKLDEDALVRRRRVLGEDHPDTMWSANGLARDFYELGDPEEARHIDENTLGRRRQILGNDHPATLQTAGNLAADLRAVGLHQAACELDEDTLDRRRRVLGEDHPDTLAAMESLAADHYALGDDERADLLIQDARRRRNRPRLGGRPSPLERTSPEHPGSA